MRIRHALLAITAMVMATVAAEEGADNPVVVITTSHGDIVCELFADQAPETVKNFVALAEGTKAWTDPASDEKRQEPFYDGLTFHRIIKGFMIQGGCPLGSGEGGPGYNFADEINPKHLKIDSQKLFPDGFAGQAHPIGAQIVHHMQMAWLRHHMQQAGAGPQTGQEELQQLQQQAIQALHAMIQEQGPEGSIRVMGQDPDQLLNMTVMDVNKAQGYEYNEDLPPSSPPVRGSLAMANVGPNTNGSQFFINLADTPHLTGRHTVFGKVIDGMDVVDAIGEVQVDSPQQGRPQEPVTIVRIRQRQ